MTEPQPEPQPYPWLPIATLGTWLGVDTTDAEQGAAVELVRRAAAAHCERQRPDLRVDVVDEAGAIVSTSWAAGDDQVQAGLIAAARLWARRHTPAGLASFGEFGASAILRLDPDVSRLLGVGRHAHPRIG